METGLKTPLLFLPYPFHSWKGFFFFFPANPTGSAKPRSAPCRMDKSCAAPRFPQLRPSSWCCTGHVEGIYISWSSVRGGQGLLRGEKPGLPHLLCTPELQRGLFIQICKSRWFLRCILVRSGSGAGIVAALTPIPSGISSQGEQAGG